MILNRHISDWARLMAIPLIVLVAWQAGIYTGRSGLSYIEILSGILLIAGVFIIGKGSDGLKLGYNVWILLMALGYRTAEIGAIRIHPLFLLIVGLTLLLLINRVTNRGNVWRVFIPRWLLLFNAFVVWGLIIAVSRNLPVTSISLGVFAYMLFIPIVIISYHILTQQRDWKRALTLFYAMGTFIAFFGVVEFYFPEIRSILPGFVAQGAFDSADQFGFTRATFSFFAHPVAVFVFAISFLSILALSAWYRSPTARLVLAITVAINLLGFYIGGYRSVWITVGAVFIGVAILRRNLIFVIGIVAALLVVYAVTPEAGRDRFFSVASAAQGDFQDTSSERRFELAQDGWELILRHPLGIGIGGSGWTHTDILKIAADLGAPALAIFVIGFFGAFIRLTRLYGSRRDPLDLALLGGMIVSLSLLMTQNVVVLPQLAAPVWFVWALSEVRLERARAAVAAGQPIMSTIAINESIPPALPPADAPLSPRRLPS
jgi:hypothetical protein